MANKVILVQMAKKVLKVLEVNRENVELEELMVL